MKNEEIKIRLKKFIKSEPATWLEEATWRENNKEWLMKSAKIAIKVLRELRNRQMSQKELADILQVTPQYVSKIVKGQENLSLDTICKLEKVLQITLIEVPTFRENIQFSNELHPIVGINKNKAEKIASARFDYGISVPIIYPDESSQAS